MKITIQSDKDFVAPAVGFHVLTYAEEGFAPLNIHANAHAISNDVLRPFADEVNRHDKAGSLHPAAPISAIPRVLIRGKENRAALLAAVKDFLRANQQSIRAKRVLCDFRTPQVAPWVVSAVEEAMRSHEAEGVDEVAIIAPAPGRASPTSRRPTSSHPVSCRKI